ncbi:hypothetical protein [Azospirillum picis]|uniref:Uncharacterized protein n=1 Tax=Azospirillum picis TaxID=488438 RepID=A0ABU0MT17_9PROT|nr:hypothetical protein [Azospirillum picis]MBP2302667.1 hypothetical protein [Azospirillum picis]MDQ0536328.1 hypothetical protein [Azospirillum picis]
MFDRPSSTSHHAIACYGTAHPPSRPRVLRAGPLSAELEDGAVRAIRWHDVEILRGVAFLVRDAHWGTHSAQLSAPEVTEAPDRFEARFQGLVEADGQRFRYDVRIGGSADGEFVFEAAGTAETDVVTCRTGFVVLHPIEGVAGRPVRIGHADGSEEDGCFPALVSPGQPIFSIRSLAHEPAPGLRALCRLDGDVFEMEDQRNWTDASFKTYVRPLALPTPYVLAAGTRLEQAVRLTVSEEATGGRGLSAAEPLNGLLRLSLGEALKARMPQVGVGIDTLRLPAQEAGAPLIRDAGVRLLVGRFDPLTSGDETLAAFARLVEATGADLLLELPLPCREALDAELGEVAARIDAARLPVAGLTVAPAAYLRSYQPSGPWPDGPSFTDIYRAARHAFPGLPVGGGVHAYFPELNRARPPVEGCDYVSFCTSPIVHAADERSIAESLGALPAVMETARSICGSLPLRIGPSAIGMRDNPYGRGPVDNPGNGRIPMARMDPRQRGLFAAGWYLGYVAELARQDAASVTLGAIAGEFGFVHQPGEWPQPWFDQEPAAIYPAYHIIRALASAGGAPLVECRFAGPGAAPVALAWQRPDGQGTFELWLANLTADPIRIDIAGVRGGRLHRLTGHDFADACRAPQWMAGEGEVWPPSELELPACSVARMVFDHRSLTNPVAGAGRAPQVGM